MDYLNDAEKQQIMAFVSNELMSKAVKKVLLAGIYQQGVAGEKKEENWAYSIVRGAKSDEQIGQEVRAAAQGLSFLANAFEKLLEYKEEPPKKAKSNPAL